MTDSTDQGYERVDDLHRIYLSVSQAARRARECNMKQNRNLLYVA